MEQPSVDEYDQPAACSVQGYWQYSLLTKFTDQDSYHRFKFDQESNSLLIKKLASNTKTGKIFIEPHLKNRMKLTNEKIRFHGCQAVRHDDHIHVQL